MNKQNIDDVGLETAKVEFLEKVYDEAVEKLKRIEIEQKKLISQLSNK